MIERLNDKDAITILSKKDSKCWFFKIKNMSKEFWEIIKNEEEW
jgi:hypothetical protein